MTGGARIACCLLQSLWIVAITISSFENVVAFNPSSLGSPFRVRGYTNALLVDKAKNTTVLVDDGDDGTEQDLVRPTRRRSTTRKMPRNYWRNISNVDLKFRNFWSELSVQISESEPPPIPNEGLLHHLGRHDLRAAIVAHGGRELLSKQLGGARIMPGKWVEAVAKSPELQQLVVPNSSGEVSSVEMLANPSNRLRLLPDIPPWSLPQVSSANETDTTVLMETLEGLKRKRWCHKKGRNPRGHWTLQLIIQELYEYLENYKIRHNRPSVWMPRPAELGSNGRTDLKQIFSNYGGATKITQLAGLVPFREWNYFEGQYRMLVELKRYLDEHHQSDYSVFPCVSEILHNGYDELHSLIQFYGGRKFVASRLSMTFIQNRSTRREPPFADLQWGAFDLDFAIQLLRFVRDDQMKQMPPMAKPVIAMPSRSKLLLTTEGQELDQSINQCGGYENVARRLGLAFFD